MQNKQFLIGGVIVLAVIVGVGFFLSKSNQPVTTNETNTDSSITTSPPEVSTSPITSETPSELGQGGSSYLDPESVYSFLYPNDYTLSPMNNGSVRITKTGPTQRGQTELYDGVLLYFETVSLDGSTLEQWVDGAITQSTADGTSQVVKPKTAMNLNGYSGFSYSMRGLGESNNLVLQKDSNSPYAVNIIYAVYDPQNVGFQNEIDAILKTLQIQK